MSDTGDRPLKVLLVEDNPGDARLVSTMLSSQEGAMFDITHVARLEEAITLMAEHSFDAVLLDLSLPDSTGIETLDRAKSRDGSTHTPFIVVSGQYSEDIGLASMQRGAQDYLHKNNLRAEALIRAVIFAVQRERQRIRVEEADAARRRDREIESLEHFSSPTTTMVSARAYGLERLAEASSDTFQVLVEQYCSLIEQATEERKFSLDSKTTQGARVLAQRLGFLRASPRDVVEMHLQSLKEMRPLKMSTSYVVAEEARLLLLELMGYLASYYRDHMIPVTRPMRMPNVEQSTDDKLT